MDFNLIHKI